MIQRTLYVLILLFLSSTVSAQKQIDRSKELKVGQELPSLPQLPLINYEDSEIDLNTLGGKVVILDFFDTYCSNCIRSMPGLQELQHDLDDKLQIVLVTWQDRETIEKFYATNAFLKEHDVQLPTVYADTLLRNYFPHRGVPHTAWLFHNTVQAITFSDFINTKNINELFANATVSLPLKSDFVDGQNSEHKSTITEKAFGSITLSGYQDGIPSEGVQIKYDSLRSLHKTSFYNIDVLGAYTAAWSKIKKPEFLLKDERIVWQVRDSSIYKYPQEGEGMNVWLAHNGICYERFDTKERSEEEQAKLILQDLNSFLGLNVYWSEKEILCLVLQKADTQTKQLDKKEEEGLEGTGVLAFMIDYQGDYPPVLDQVNSMQRMQIDDYSSLDTINEQLEKYGLVLVENTRELEVLVFEEVL